MTSAQILKSRIKNQCEKQEKSMSVMLSELSLGVNAINQINEKKGIGSFVLSKIADYLECSVDYLLGRTDEPEYNSISISEQKQNNFDEMSTELLKKFNELSFDEKLEVFNYIKNIKEK